jgi:hypothetical protein
VVDNLSLPLRGDCPATGCQYIGPYHLDFDFLRVLSKSAIPKCRALKVSLPPGFIADGLQPDYDDDTMMTTTEGTVPMSFAATPNLRYLSWTSNLPLSAPIPPEFEFPWRALRHVQHGLTWSLWSLIVHSPSKIVCSSFRRDERTLNVYLLELLMGLGANGLPQSHCSGWTPCPLRELVI